MLKQLIRLLSLLLIQSAAFSQQTETFKIGAILPLTGPFAEYGVAAKNGFELALKEYPQKFKNIKIIYEDSLYDGKTTLASYQKLKGSDKVSLVYIWGYSPNQAVVPVAEKDKSPVFAISAERSVSMGKEYTLRYCYHIEQIANALLAHIRIHNFKRIGIVKAELAYMNGLITFMRKNLKADEVIEVVDTYPPGDTDFRNTITKLKSKHFDTIGIFLVSGQISQFYRQSAQQSFKPETFGTDFFDTMKEARDAQGTMKGAIFAAPFADPEFTSRYIKEYGNDNQVAWAANAYEFANLSAKLFANESSPLTAEEILAKYKNNSQEQGSASRFKFNESVEGSGFDFKVVLRKIEADKIVDLEE